LNAKGMLYTKFKFGYLITVGSFIVLLIFGWQPRSMLGMQQTELVSQRSTTESNLISDYIKNDLTEGGQGGKSDESVAVDNTVCC